MPQYGDVFIEINPHKQIVNVQSGVGASSIKLVGDVVGGAGTQVVETSLADVLSSGVSVENIDTLTIDEKGRVVSWTTKEQGLMRIVHYIVTFNGQNNWLTPGIAQVINLTINGVSYYTAAVPDLENETVSYRPTQVYAADPPYTPQINDTVIIWYF